MDKQTSKRNARQRKRQNKRLRENSSNQKNRSDPPVQGERLMTYPAPIHPFDPDWHYPDCAAPVGEDNDCRHCIPFRILDYDIQEALEQLRKEKHDKHYNGFSAKKARKISWDELEDEYYNPGSEIRNKSRYKELRDKMNKKIRERVEAVDNYFARKNGELMDLDKEEKVVDSMDVDPKPTNSIIVQNNGVQVTLEWDDKGIKFEGNEHPWFMIKYWQNKIKRKTKSPIRIRSWQGPYASCWCILEDKSHKNLDDNQECNRCEYWISVLHYISKLPEEVTKPLTEAHIIHPWYKPIETLDRTWQTPNHSSKFQVQLLTKKAIIPNKAYASDAAWDIFAAEDCVANENGVAIVPTHIKLQYEKGYYGQLKTKSSQAIKGITVLGGILDEGYKGEIKVILQRALQPDLKIKQGEKVAQLIICKNEDVTEENVHLEERGIRGFGSSGKWAKDSETLKDREKRLKQILNITTSKDPEITLEQKEQLSKLLKKYASSFVENSSDIQTTVKGFEHSIELLKENPICEANRHMSPIKKAFLKEELQKMKEKGVISECPPNTPWGFQVVIVKKKDGTLRLCVDYRKLNQVTVRDEYPLPKIQELIDRMGKAKYFTSLDLASGYWQVPMNPKSKKYTAFVCPYGQFQFNVMPFGLTNAPATFQRMMDRILNELREDFCEVYLDDILIYSETFEQHLKHIERVIQRLDDYGLKLKHKKCHFAQLETEYLGFILGNGSYRTAPRIIEAIQNFPEPKLNEEVKLKDIQSFLGVCNFYRKFIDNYKDLIAPINKLLAEKIKTRIPAPKRSRKKWIITEEKNSRIWTEEHHIAFQKIKEVFQKTREEGGIRLAYPIPGRKFIIRTDASKEGIGAVLAQVSPDGGELPIMYAHRVYNEAEKYYPITDQEGLAVKDAIKKWFHPYIWGESFKLYTDHQPLLSAFKNRTIDGRLGKWIYNLSEFDFELIHVQGEDNAMADKLSRCPKPHKHTNERRVKILFTQFKIINTEFQLEDTVLRSIN